MKKYICILALALTGCGEHHKDMPPGFKLSCDGKGHYIVRRTYLDLVVLPYTGQGRTKQDAIDRAWDQYEWEHRPDPREKEREQLDLEYTEECE